MKIENILDTIAEDAKSEGIENWELIKNKSLSTYVIRPEKR